MGKLRKRLIEAAEEAASFGGAAAKVRLTLAPEGVIVSAHHPSLHGTNGAFDGGHRSTLVVWDAVAKDKSNPLTYEVSKIKREIADRIESPPDAFGNVENFGDVVGGDSK